MHLTVHPKADVETGKATGQVDSQSLGFMAECCQKRFRPSYRPSYRSSYRPSRGPLRGPVKDPVDLVKMIKSGTRAPLLKAMNGVCHEKKIRCGGLWPRIIQKCILRRKNVCLIVCLSRQTIAIHVNRCQISGGLVRQVFRIIKTGLKINFRPVQIGSGARI